MPLLLGDCFGVDGLITLGDEAKDQGARKVLRDAKLIIEKIERKTSQ